MIEPQHNIPLSRHTSWKVGGRAECLFQPKNVDELASFLQSLAANEPVTWLGLGSNVLVRDGGIKGVVIVTFPALNSLVVQDNMVTASAGVACAQVARFSARHNLAGLEFLAGIPGTIGGALAMNAGCHGGETWDYVKRVRMINHQGKCYYREPKNFDIAYREVKHEKDEWFFEAEFVLPFGDKTHSFKIIRELLNRRAATQPTHLPSCGSVFRNPPNDHAARLIEAVGLKGFSIGGAQVSTKHANFIVNTGDATASDIEALIKHIEAVVWDQFSIKLQREVQIIGEC